MARLGTQKKPPCVDSKRPRVYRHHAHMCYHMRAWRLNTRGRFESTHGGFFWTDTRGEMGVTVSSAYQEKPTKSSHLAPQVHRKKPLDLTHSRFENRSRTTRSRVLQSFALPGEAVELHFYLEGNFGGISTHNTEHTHTHTDPPTTTLLPSPSPSHTHTHTHMYMHVCMYMHVYLCMCVYAHVDVYVHVYVHVFVFVCVCLYVYDLPQWFHVCATSLIYIYIYIYIFFYVIMNRHGRHSIRNGVAWAQKGHGTFT